MSGSDEERVSERERERERATHPNRYHSLSTAALAIACPAMNKE